MKMENNIEADVEGTVTEVKVRKGDSVAVTDNIWGLDLDGTLQGSGGVGGLLAVIRDDGVFLPAYDANGNITEYVSTNGTVAAHYEYSAFGEPIVTDGELAATFTHQFSTNPYYSSTWSIYSAALKCPTASRTNPTTTARITGTV